MNPYLNRLTIHDPKQFFGRKREVSRILSRIGAQRPQSVSIVGERKIGKSSLLYYLTHREIQEQHLGPQAGMLVAFMDFQQLRQISLQDFFVLLLNEIRRVDPQLHYDGPGARGPSAGYQVFREVLEVFRDQGKRLIVMFDEFDAVTSNSAFDVEFYSFLRSMANNYSVAYLTSSRTELQRLCCSSEIADSPFFNIFSNLYLKPFQRDEVLELITIPAEQQGIPLAAYAGEIIALAGLFPFYLQIACSVYFDHLQRNPNRPPNSHEVKSQFIEEAGPHFEYFWEHAPLEYRVVLERLIRGNQPTPEETYVCQKLVRDGYVIEEDKQFRVFSAAFADHIRMLESSGDHRRRMTSTLSLKTGVQVAPGTAINQYSIVRKTAEGGMGIIYEAQDNALGRKVALKFVRPELLSLDTSRKRFLQEARAAASLNHPVITSIYELFEEGDQIILVMEWIEGVTLKKRISNSGRIERRQLLAWIIETCEGLEAAHRHGVVHRDIKSSNLMITLQNHVKIMDFGLAKFSSLETASFSQLTIEGSILGTLDYMSPEQARGDRSDHRSDLFSLGIVLFEGLTGKLPFQRERAAATLHAVVHDPAPDLELYGVEEVDKLDLILRKLLAKSPDNRYPGAAELKKDLRELLKRRQGLFSWLR